MSPSSKGGPQPNFGKRFYVRLGKDPASQTKDVGVVVFRRQGRCFFAPDHRCAHAFDFVCGDAHANPCPANQKTPIGFFPRHRAAHQTRVVGVIGGLFIARAHVGDRVTVLSEGADQKLFRCKSPVIGTDDKFQALFVNFMIRAKSSAFKLAPPTSPPSISRWAIN